ncbi:hypothetical protein M8C21_002773 [Ambrosia artemisiifolia]|uniref:S-locus glycoprotein n=1 Tax=Ambrosia artemisiifolia TaxID=4212 RepID=A0AAD5GNN7_AMBAR|nr:hypothetical protein M8C21_002773 [Ambrosia artemisiifolia]
MINLIAFQLFFYAFLIPAPAPSSAANTLPVNQYLSVDQKLVSRNGNFEMGFFRPAYDKQTNTKRVLTSWRNNEDPGVGLFSLEIDQNNKQYQISYVDNENETYFTYSLWNPSIITRFIIDVPGQVNQMSWYLTGKWDLFWSQPRLFCDIYGGCGAFGVCNQQGSPFCTCLTDFEPRSQSDWNLGGFSGGCVRKNEVNCSVIIEKPVFVLSYVRESFISAPPEYQAMQLSETTCGPSCLDDCNCTAYTFINNTMCIYTHFNSTLKLLQKVFHLL